MKDRIIKRGFELLKTRSLNEKVNIEDIENKYDIKLPPLYNLFASTFKVGESESNVAYILPDNIKQYCAGIVYESEKINSDEVMFDNFLTVESTISSFDADDDWLEMGYLPIATCGHGGMILIGTQGEMKDLIFLQDSAQMIKMLNVNIFDFVRSLVLLEVSEEELIGDTRYSQLYKKWRETFWRVNENIR